MVLVGLGFGPKANIVLDTKWLPTFRLVGDWSAMPAGKNKGLFWPKVRVLIWEKAQELYQHGEARGVSRDFTGTTATRKELVEGGYFQEAKIIVLRELLLQRKGSVAASGEEGSRKEKYHFLEET